MGVILFAVKLVMVLTMTLLLPKSWGTEHHEVTVVSHVQKHLLILYKRDGRKDFDVIASHSQSNQEKAGSNTGHSKTVSLDKDTAFSWKDPTDESYMETLALVDKDNPHHQPQSTVDVYDGNAKHDGLTIEFKPFGLSRKRIDDYCITFGFDKHAVTVALLYGKKVESISRNVGS